MYKKLEDIGNITTGVYEKGSPSGDTYYLHAKHFDEYGNFRDDAILSPEIHMDERIQKHTLQDNDLLITAKGESNRVCLYQEDIGQSVASSTFFVLRLNGPYILAGYLQWYLNTPKMQSVISSFSKGTRILSLSKKALSKVEVEIPTIRQQQQILKLHSLWENERKITLELLDQKELFYQNLLLNLTSSKQTEE